VIVDVNVIGPVIVDVNVNLNDTVIVIAVPLTLWGSHHNRDAPRAPSPSLWRSRDR
jgi:hypothetical protein